MNGLFAFLILLATMHGSGYWQTVAMGPITHYDCHEHCRKLTRSEEPYDPASYTIAVDDSLWPTLAGRWVRITNLETGKIFLVRVNDSGYLAEADIAGDLPEETWVLISGKGKREGVFEGKIEMPKEEPCQTKSP